jgi:hypothetical protein
MVGSLQLNSSFIYQQFPQITGPFINYHMHYHDFSEYARSQQWKIFFGKGLDGGLVVTATNNSYYCNVGDRNMAPDETVGFCK